MATELEATETDAKPYEPLKKIPGFTVGVRANSAVRMMKLARPICPNSQRRRQADGTFAEVGENCQRAGGRWWEMCEELGHNPYFTTTVRYEPVDVMDEDGFVTGQKKRPITEVRPNIVQVAINRRINNGRGVLESMRNKGRLRLRDIGYEECCEFRNCQKPISDKAKSKAFGNYCSVEHLSLIAADAQGMFLHQTDGLAATFSDGSGAAQRKRQRLLREAIAFADTE